LNPKMAITSPQEPGTGSVCQRRVGTVTTQPWYRRPSEPTPKMLRQEYGGLNPYRLVVTHIFAWGGGVHLPGAESLGVPTMRYWVNDSMVYGAVHGAERLAIVARALSFGEIRPATRPNFASLDPSTSFQHGVQPQCNFYSRSGARKSSIGSDLKVRTLAASSRCRSVERPKFNLLRSPKRAKSATSA